MEDEDVVQEMKSWFNANTTTFSLFVWSIFNQSVQSAFIYLAHLTTQIALH